MIKIVFFFSLETLFSLKIFNFLFWLFDHVEKRLDLKDNFNFKICKVVTWEANIRNTHIAQYLKK